MIEAALGSHAQPSYQILTKPGRTAGSGSIAGSAPTELKSAKECVFLDHSVQACREESLSSWS